jgi:SAM-dependent methyltransferase
MKNLWDTRYATDEFVYGKEPNTYFASQLALLAPGTLLLPGEGEGRNAVHAASAGWKVEAFDQSRVAAEKALAYAAEKGLLMEYRVSGIEEFAFQADTYDAAGLIYVHAPPPLRKLLHSKVLESLKPGGRVILEAFHVSQLGNNTGGPGIPELLFTEEIIRSDFARLEPISLEQDRVILEEGAFHRGEAEVIRFVGRKTQ